MPVRQPSRDERKRQERQALSFPIDARAHEARPTGEPVTVADGLLRVRVAMPMALEHINVYLLRDDDGWWLIDTGLNTEHSKQCWEAVAADSQALEGLPFKALICTHYHFDHTGLAHWLTKRFGIPLYMSRGDYFMLRALTGRRDRTVSDAQQDFYARAGMPAAQVDALLEALGQFPSQPACPESFYRLSEGDTLTIGGRRWQVFVGTGHAPEHVCLYDPRECLLVAGDQVLPEISSNIMVGHIEPEADPMSGWLASLERLDTLDARTLVLPGHGEVFRNLGERVQQLRDHHARQFDHLRALAARSPGFCAFDAMRWMFPQELDGTQLLLALGEAIAHLTWLTKNADLTRTLEDGVYVFHPAGQAGAAVG